MFTKKHFVDVAIMLRNQLASAGGVHADEEVLKLWISVARGMRSMFAESNPRFDEDAFNNACGITALEHLSSSTV